MDDTTKCEWDPALHHGEKCPHHEGGGGSSDLAGPKEAVFGDKISDIFDVLVGIGLDIDKLSKPSFDPNQFISLVNFEKAREKIFSYDYRPKYELFTDAEMEEINVSVKKLFDRSHIGTFVKYHKAVNGKQTNLILQILQEDEIKNQFQSGVSGGCFHYDTRARASAWLFGSEGVTDGPNKHENRLKLEKYGCMVDGDLTKIKKYQEAASQYGNCYFIYKDSVRDRTTFTPDDSLGPSGNFQTRYVASYINEGLHKRQIENKDYFLSRKSFAFNSVYDFGKSVTSDSSYVELQTHGKIQPSQDVDAIFMSSGLFDYEGDDAENQQILKLAAEKGIDILTTKYIYGQTTLVRVSLDENGQIKYSPEGVDKYNRHLR